MRGKKHMNKGYMLGEQNMGWNLVGCQILGVM